MAFELREVRRTFGITQVQLAEMLGVNQATVSRWEREPAEIDRRRRLQLADIFFNKTDNLTKAVERLVLHHNSCAVLDEEGKFLHIAENHAKALKIDPADIIGRRYHDITDDGWRAAILSDVESAGLVMVEIEHDLHGKGEFEHLDPTGVQTKLFSLDTLDFGRLTIGLVNKLPVTGQPPRLIRSVTAADLDP